MFETQPTANTDDGGIHLLQLHMTGSELLLHVTPHTPVCTIPRKLELVIRGALAPSVRRFTVTRWCRTDTSHMKEENIQEKVGLDYRTNHCAHSIRLIRPRLYLVKTHHIIKRLLPGTLSAHSCN